MTDGSTESRLARVEQGMIDVNRRVDTLVDLPKLVAVLTEQVKNLVEDLSTFAAQAARRDEQAAQDRKDAVERERARRADRAATRKWAIGILVVVLIGLITAGATLAAVFH